MLEHPPSGKSLMPLLASVLFALASTSARAMPTTGDSAPDFAGRTYDGQSLSLAAYTGKVVVLTFWASWCPPCQKEIPILEGIQRVAGKDRIQVIAVNIENRETFRRIAPKMSSLQLTVASDTAKEAQAAYGVNGIPHMVIIDRSGRIVQVHRGYTEEAVDEVLKDVNKALAR
jgi:peroxiredoxin